MILHFPHKKCIKNFVSAPACDETKYGRMGQRIAPVGSLAQNLTTGHANCARVIMFENTAPKAQLKSDFPATSFDYINDDFETYWLLEGLLPKEGFLLFDGEKKSAKTFMLFDMSMHVALGWSYRGKPIEGGDVAYVLCEGHSGFRKRVTAFRQNKLAEGATGIPFHLIHAMVKLPSERERLATTISNLIGVRPLKLLVIDTLNKTIEGDENSAVDMGNYIKAIEYLREYFGCLVVVIHHAGHNAERARGHSSLLAAVDGELWVKKKGDKITVTTKMMRDSESGDNFVAELQEVEIGRDKSGSPVKSCIIKHNCASDEKVLNLVAAGMKQRDVAAQLNLSKDQVYRILKRHSVALLHPSKEGMQESVREETISIGGL